MWDEACDFEHELDHFRDNLSKFEGATDGGCDQVAMALQSSGLCFPIASIALTLAVQTAFEDS